MAADIIPALLVRSKRELEASLERLVHVAPWVQVDFVASNYMEGGETFPLWEEFNFEVDLMLLHPAQEVESMVRLGASRVVVHAANAESKQALELLQQYRSGDFAVEVGVALRAHDTPDALQGLDGQYDYVQVMGIDREGAQGEPPDPHHKEVELVRALRAKYPTLLIQVDGAAAAHPRELVEAGANRLVVGGAIVNADNPKTIYKSLYNEANGSH
ncbi:MAG TPA: hypothetical protein VGP13_03555 [Candidatus Paceibacterota bacterium]|jgi:pentose-5-phosphate-3-epimerase|nr:hypothetical protein [Candidatus Paceibacterota bacterium]